MADLYIDISSGSSVTELINKIVSSDQFEVDELVVSMNERFGQIAHFSYQSMQQDGKMQTQLYVESQRFEGGHTFLEEIGSKASKHKDLGPVEMHIPESSYIKTFMGDRRKDKLDTRSLLSPVSVDELSSLSLRWPAKTQLMGAAFYNILRTYSGGQIYILDRVKLSNGMVYTLGEAWEHRNCLHAEECAALGALIAHGHVLSEADFIEGVSGGKASYAKHPGGKEIKVYFVK